MSGRGTLQQHDGRVTDMRLQGRIIRWNDDRGFGFIVPDEGGQDVFLHVSAFRERGRRPAESEPVTYDLGRDAQGRPRAQDVVFVERRSLSLGLNGALVLLSGGFLCLVAAATFAGRLMPAVAGLYLAASLLAFVAYALDKSAAEAGRWRISENSLHMLSLVGGWPGALMAQRLLRHKSRKASFQVEYWVTVALNCSALAWILTPSGSRMLHVLLG